MLREYCGFIKDYLKLAEIKPLHLVMIILSAFFYKGFSILLPLVGSFIIKYLTEQNPEMSYLSLALFLAIYALYNLALVINYKVYTRTIIYTYDKMTAKVLKKLVSVDNNFSTIISKGHLMNSINSDIIDVGEMSDNIAEATTGIFQIVAVLAIVCFYNIPLAIYFAVSTLAIIFLRNLADRRINLYHNKVVADDDRFSTLLTQVIAGLSEMKTFNLLSKFTHKLEKIQQQYAKHYTKKRRYWAYRDGDIDAIFYLFRFVLYLILIALLANQVIDVSVLILMVSYHEYLASYADDLISSTTSIREVHTAVTRINDILNYDSKEIVFGAVDLDDIYGALELKNVSLSLKNKPILKNLNLKIKRGEVVAIVGEAGSGKTMLLNLILRLYKPTRGEILLDNINILDFNKKVYANNVSIANQKPFIFNMSIRKNLSFVDPDIKHQIEACKTVGIHDFIETLPDGYNTILRENGSNVSGGQKQLISIARTLLSNAEVLLLDDITTSLDTDTAKLVPKLIEKLKDDHTIVMITKNPELMKAADRIVVLKNGKINAVGTHTQLLAHNPIYQLLQSRKSPSKTEDLKNV